MQDQYFSALRPRGQQCLTPLELLDRLAALVPPPRLHRHRYLGARVRTTAYRRFR